MREQWNQRYSSDTYIYGKEPNKFFKEELDKLTPGKILLPAEGEGRNAVYAAMKGWQVDAVDYSEAGKEKALRLAAERNVRINYTVNDLVSLSPGENIYDAAGIVFVHLDSEIRERFHQAIIKSLKPGGTLIMEVYEKDQIKMTSGGPKDIELLYSLEEIVEAFVDLDFISLSKENIILNESDLHSGEAWVIRFVAKRI